MFGERLKLLRKSRGITQEQLAEIIGVERSSIGKYEGKSKTIPSDDVKAKIADYFNVSTDYLLGRSDVAEPTKNMFQVRLKTLRERAGLSQAALAKKVGVGQSTVGMWESGRNKPENAKLEALANLLGVSTDYLLGRSDVAEPAKNQPIADGDELDRELIDLMRDLSPEDFQRVKDFVAGLKAARGASSSRRS